MHFYDHYPSFPFFTYLLFYKFDESQETKVHQQDFTNLQTYLCNGYLYQCLFHSTQNHLVTPKPKQSSVQAYTIQWFPGLLRQHVPHHHYVFWSVNADDINIFQIEIHIIKRYFAIFIPLHHRTERYHKLLLISLGFTWLISLSVGIWHAVFIHRVGPSVENDSLMICGVQGEFMPYSGKSSSVFSHCFNIF